MSLLLESIKIEKGEGKHLSFHEDRMNRSRAELWGTPSSVNLKTTLSIPKGLPALVKARIIYGKRIHSIQFLPYQLPSINSLTLVEDNQIDYHLKFSDRSQLAHVFQQRRDSDDVLIIKNGWVTDSYYCNAVFLREGQYFTPQHSLLKGVKRSYLIHTGIIKECAIKASEILNFEKIFLINAMIELGECEVLMNQIADPSNLMYTAK